MRNFTYERSATIAESIAQLEGLSAGGGDVHMIAGGTDLLTLMKADVIFPDHIIDIKRLVDLDKSIRVTDGGVTIGALATLAQIESDSTLKRLVPALTQAASLAASPQIRNMATIGGNLLQRPRCWYYRDAEVPCWLKGSSDCPAIEGENQLHAIYGESPCHAVHPSDPATMLMALDASLEIAGPQGGRRIPIADFFAEPESNRRIEHTLRPNEVITAITIPIELSGRSAYVKAMDRKVWAFALVGAGVHLVLDGKVIIDARIVLGGVATIPWRRHQAESMLIGSIPTNDLFARAAAAAVEGASPLLHNGYKVQLAKTLVERAFESAMTDS